MRGAGIFLPCGGGVRWRGRILMLFIDHASGSRNALMPRGHFLLSSHKRKQKEPRGHPATPCARHCGSLLSVSHVKTHSAKLPKLDDSHRLKHRGSYVSALPCAAGQKPPHEPRREILRALPWPTESGDGRSSFSNFFFFVEPYFYKQKAAAQPGNLSTTLVLTRRLRLWKR